MDHAIDVLEPYLEAEFSDFIEEWKTGKYKRYSEAPSYAALKALIDATNILNKYMGWELISIRGRLEDIGLLHPTK